MQKYPTHSPNLSEMKLPQLQGNENFVFDGKQLPFAVIEFWKWSYSNLIVNKLRGVLAEYIVAKALQIDTSKTRVEWDEFDLLSPKGFSIEVKSASYIQSWEQEKFSPISFNIAGSQAWDKERGKYFGEVKRRADFYVLCLLAHKVQATLNPLELSQWEFYVIPTKILNEKLGDQKKAALTTIKRLGFKAINYEDIEAELARLIKEA